VRSSLPGATDREYRTLTVGLDNYVELQPRAETWAVKCIREIQLENTEMPTNVVTKQAHSRRRLSRGAAAKNTFSQLME
jgi:hypothetical protein